MQYVFIMTKSLKNLLALNIFGSISEEEDKDFSTLILVCIFVWILAPIL